METLGTFHMSWPHPGPQLFELAYPPHDGSAWYEIQPRKAYLVNWQENREGGSPEDRAQTTGTSEVNSSSGKKQEGVLSWSQ